VAVNGGATLKTFAALQGSSTLNSNGGVGAFQYAPSGNASATDTLDLCDDRAGETGRRITVTNTGRVITANLACP
jgi:type IV fimbrial biogenesis protein FimT